VMHDRGKSDDPVVPAKLPNNAQGGAAEVAEGSGSAEGNTASETRPGPRAGHGALSDLDRVRRAARNDKDARFTALLHHVDVGRLRAAYWAIRPKAAPGVDGVTWTEYGQDLEANLRDLHARVHRGSYRARPSRRVFVAKADGRLRPLGVAALEDKILQRALAEVLNAIYEADFLGFSYGFRPGRSPHDALDALAAGIVRRRVNWVLDTDFREFFTSLDHRWLERFLEHRIADKRVLWLIQKWMAAGVIEDGAWTESLEGVPQGASASPLLANVYLHYVFDLWAHQWRTRHARGDVVIVRFADDAVVGFEYREDAERFWADLRERLAKFRLELNAEKTRLIRFGRFAAQTAEGAGSRQAGNVPVPRLHAHLREDEEGALQAQADHRQETDAREAQRGQSRADATATSAHPRPRTLARQRPARALQLLRGARQQQGDQRLPLPDHRPLAGCAETPKPARPTDLEADVPHR
jgi:RNA-directed DNA polymerase